MSPTREPGGPRNLAREALRRLLPERTIEREVDEELRFHVEQRARELQEEEGLSPDEARARALAIFGDLDALRTECRGIGREMLERRTRREWVAELAREARLAARTLRRSPGFSAAATLILALGVGASVSVFSVLYDVMLRPLPYDEPERLVRVWPEQTFNASMVRWFEGRTDALTGIAGRAGWTFTLSGDGRTEQVQGAVVTPEYFDVLGVEPHIGRTFLPEEEQHESSGVVLLSYGFWQRRFGGDPGVLGRALPLETFGRPLDHRVIGVLPEDFRSPAGDVEVWAPLQNTAQRVALARSGAGPGSVGADSTWFVNEVVARLAPGATVEQATEQVRAAARLLQEQVPAVAPAEQVELAGVRPLLEATVSSARPVLWAAFGGAGLVLLIACANVSALVLVRSARKRADAAVRAALGAGQGRLISERLVEAALLSGVGGGLGVLLAGGLLGAARSALASAGLPRAGTVSLNLPAVGFAVAVGAGSAVLFAVLSALSDSRAAPGGALRNGARPGATGARHALDRTLVAAEVALATVLLFGAGLALRSLVTLLSVDPGLRTDDVVAVSIEPPVSQLTTGEARRAFYQEVEERIAALPGVQSVGSIHLLPLTDNNWSFPYLAEGHAPPPNAPLPSANFRVVTPGYFRTVGVPLLLGREFDERDRDGEPGVVILNRRMADELWPGESALGKEVRVFGNMPLRVVGVVGDVRQHTLDVAPRPEMYLPFGQYSLAAMSVLARAPELPAGALEQLRVLVWGVNPSVAVPRVVALDQLVAATVAERRFVVQLLVGFGIVALLLAGFGVYGVTAYLVSLRIPELGLRLALGARPGSLGSSTLLWGLVPVVAGSAAGVVGSLAAARAASGLLFGVAPSDPATLAGVVSLLAGVALLATWIPARRAARLDPTKALSGY